MRKKVLKSVVIALFLAIAVFAAVSFLRPKFTGVRAGKADENYIKSIDCKACHEEHYDSWDKTHHSKMTQIASSKSVLADFTQSFEYQGIKAEMKRQGEDFFINFIYPDGKTDRNKIKYTIGSRRYQEYAAEKDGKTIRLPIHWLIAEKRWATMNSAFFYPDERPLDASRAQWDTNCVFCHNVKAQPNLNFQTLQAKTEVSELGIACGACHGQGAEHADQYSSPLSRFFSKKDEKIIQPEKIDSDRSLMICGHCHGQRIPAEDQRIREIMTKGDPFNAGDDLSKIYKPVNAGTKIGNLSFESRFWVDGSPRLTAYEYQGIMASPCFLKSKSDGKSGISGQKINCLSCHTMHDGDIKGQITEEMRSNQACNQCHLEFKEEKALAEHTKHRPDSSGSNCYSCHMPEVVYGVMDFHRSHQISNPRPALTAEKGIPNACNQCHIDKSVNWAIGKTKENWPGYKETTAAPEKQYEGPEGIRALFAGDALTRAWAAYSINKYGDTNFFAPFLMESFANENYPIVRYFTASGIAAHSKSAKPDYLSPAEERASQMQAFMKESDSGRISEARSIGNELRKKRKDIDLEIGE